jgi:hypothetical protein
VSGWALQAVRAAPLTLPPAGQIVAGHAHLAVEQPSREIFDRAFASGDERQLVQVVAIFVDLLEAEHQRAERKMG